jgi:dolichyl-diphosphooligosaccharide--protein glycosyltransferase
MWLVSVAGRFLNNLVPIMAILAGFMLWYVIKKLDFGAMMKSLRGIGGGWYGIKRSVKPRHIAGALCIALFLLVPNGWMAFDAAIPSTIKRDYYPGFGEENSKAGAFGLGVGTERYWQHAFKWLREQHEDIEDHADRPAFISWWDYGFYCVAIAQTPTVADNFQEGIPAAANFHTSEHEFEAITVLITRLAEGDLAENDGVLSAGVKAVVAAHMGNRSDDLITVWESPAEYANSTYDDIIGEEFDGEQYRVREENARYHDATTLMLSTLDEEGLVTFYKDLQEATGHEIRYYGVEGYDVNIFNVFTFLADRGSYGYETAEDRYFKLYYVSEKTGQQFTPDELEGITESMTQEDIQDIYGTFNPQVERKQAFYESMVYQTYLGSVPRNLFENYSTYGIIPFLTNNPYNPLGDGVYYYYPTAYMKHFYLEYLSPVNETQKLLFNRASLCAGMPAVVIAKYYEGAVVEGVVISEGQPMEGVRVLVQDDFSQTLDLSFGSQSYTRTLERTPPDVDTTDANGTFSVIVPAGETVLSFYSDSVLVEEIVFNGTGDFRPISEAEARRDVAWTRDIGVVDVKRGDITGIVYYDKDNNGKYNASVDEPVRAQVNVGSEAVQTGNDGRYELTSLLPSTFSVTAVKSGYDAKRADVNVKPDVLKWHNISVTPSKVSLSGKVWIDENENGRRDDNETVANAYVNVTVLATIDDTGKAKNESKTSNADGNYSLSLYPGTYALSAEFSRVEGTETVTYSYSGKTFTVGIGDAAKTSDLRLTKT